MSSVSKHEVLSKRRSNQFVKSGKNEDKPLRKDEDKAHNKRQATRIPCNNSRVLSERAKTSKESGNLKSKDIFKFTDSNGSDDQNLIGDTKKQSRDNSEQNTNNKNADENTNSIKTEVNRNEKKQEIQTKQKTKLQDTANQIANEVLSQSKDEIADNSNIINDHDSPLNRSDQENICLEQQSKDSLEKQTSINSIPEPKTKMLNKTDKKSVLSEKPPSKIQSQLPRSLNSSNRSQTNKIKSENQSKQNQRTSTKLKPSPPITDTKLRRSKSTTPPGDSKLENDQQESKLFSKPKSVSGKIRINQSNKTSSFGKPVYNATGKKVKESKIKCENAISNVASMKLSTKSLSQHNQTYENGKNEKEVSTSSDQLETKLDSSMDSSCHSNHDRVIFTMSKNENGKTAVSQKTRTKKVSVNETRTSAMRRSRSRSITPGASSVSSESSHSSKSTSSSHSSKTGQKSKFSNGDQKNKESGDSTLVLESLPKNLQSTMTKSVATVKSYMRTTESMKHKQSRASDSTVITMDITKSQTSITKSQISRVSKNNQKAVQQKFKTSERNANKSKSTAQREKFNPMGTNSTNYKVHEKKDGLPLVELGESIPIEQTLPTKEKGKLISRNTQRPQNISSIKQPIRTTLTSERNDSQTKRAEHTKLTLNKGSKIQGNTLRFSRGKEESSENSNIGANKLSNKPKLSAIKSEECKNRTTVHKSKLIASLPSNVSNRVSKVSKQNFRFISTESDSRVNSKTGKIRIAQQDLKSNQPTVQDRKSENMENQQILERKNEEINIESGHTNKEEICNFDRSRNNQQYSDKKLLTNSRKITTLEEKQLSREGNGDSVNTELLLESGELDCPENNIVLQEKRSKNGNQCESGVISEFFSYSNPGDMHSLIQIRDRFEVMNDKNSVSMETVCAIASECNEMGETGHCSVVRVDKLSESLSDSQLSNIAENVGESTQSVQGFLTEEPSSFKDMDADRKKLNIAKNGTFDECQMVNLGFFSTNTDEHESIFMDYRPISDNYGVNKTSDKNAGFNDQNDRYRSKSDLCSSVLSTDSSKTDFDQVYNTESQMSLTASESEKNASRKAVICESQEGTFLCATNTQANTYIEQNDIKWGRDENQHQKATDSVTNDEIFCDQMKKHDHFNSTNEKIANSSGQHESESDSQCTNYYQNPDDICCLETSLTENKLKNLQQGGNPEFSISGKDVCIYSKINEDDRINSYILMETGGSLRHKTGAEGCNSQQNDNKNDKNRNIKLCNTGASVSFKTLQRKTDTQKLNSQSTLCTDRNTDKSLSDNSRSLSNQTSGEYQNIDKGMQDCLEFKQHITDQSLPAKNDGLNCNSNSESFYFGNIRDDGMCLNGLENNELWCQVTCGIPEVQQTFTCNKIEVNDKQESLSLLDNNCDKFLEFDQEERENSALNCPEIYASSQPPIKLILHDDNKIPGNLELCCDITAITNEQEHKSFVAGLAEQQGAVSLNSSMKNESVCFQDKDSICDVKVISAIDRGTPENSEKRNEVGNTNLFSSCISDIECANESHDVSKQEDFKECPTENAPENKRGNYLAISTENKMEKQRYCVKNVKSVENCIEENDSLYSVNNKGNESAPRDDEKGIRAQTNSLDDLCSNLFHKHDSDLCDVYSQNSILKSSIMENVHQGNLVENDIKINESTLVFDKKAQISQNGSNSFVEKDCFSKKLQDLHSLNFCIEKTRKCDSDREIKFLESKNKCDVVKIARQRDSQSCTAKHHGKTEEFEFSEQNPCFYQNNYQHCEQRQDISTMDSVCEMKEIKSNDCIAEQDNFPDLHSSVDSLNIFKGKINLELYESINKHSPEPISSTDHLSKFGDKEWLQNEITPENFEKCLQSELTQCSIININCYSEDQKEKMSRSNIEKMAIGSSEFVFDRNTTEFEQKSARDLETSRDLYLIRLTDSDNRCELKSYNPNIHQDFLVDEMSDLSRTEFISQTCSCNQIVSENSTLPGDLPELNSTVQNSKQTQVICSVDADNSTCALNSTNFSDSLGFQKGNHDLKLECVDYSQTITPDISSNVKEILNFEANTTGNQCINFEGKQPESLDTVQQDSDYQFNKTQTFDVQGLEQGNNSLLQLSGSPTLNTVLNKQNVLDYDTIDGQIFGKCENNPVDVTEKSTLLFIDSKITCSLNDQVHFSRYNEKKEERLGNVVANLDLKCFDNSDIISGNLQTNKSEHGFFLISGQEPESEIGTIQTETEIQHYVYDNVISKPCDASSFFRRKNNFIKSSSLTNFRSVDTTGIELTTTSSSLQTLSTKNIPIQDTSSGICNNAGEALCDNISDITDIFEDSGDNFVDAEETFDTDIDITDFDITNSSSCASDLYKQDDTLQEPEVNVAETDVTSGIVIDVTTDSDSAEICKCRESLTSTESFQDAFDDFIGDCVQKSITGDRTAENENYLLQASSSLPLDVETSFEKSENIVLDHNFPIHEQEENVMSADVNMERRRRREVSAITTIVTGSSVSQHVCSAEYRNSSAIKDNSYQQKTSSTKLKETQHINESQFFRSTDSRNESGQKVIENVIKKTGNEELPVLLCSVTTSGENRKVELTSFSNMQNQKHVLIDSVTSKRGASTLGSVNSSKYSKEMSEAKSNVTSLDDVERQIETAVSIRTQKRRRRQVQKSECVSEIELQKSECISEIELQKYTVMINERPDSESVEDGIKIELDNSALISSRSDRSTHEDKSVSVYIDQSSKTTDPTLNDSNQTSCPIENDSEHTVFNLISMADPENVAFKEQSTVGGCIVGPEQTSHKDKGITLDVICSESLCTDVLSGEIQSFREENKRHSPTLTCISSDGKTTDTNIQSNSVLQGEQAFTINVQTVKDTGKYDDLDDIEYIDADDIPEVDKDATKCQQDDITNTDDSPNASFTLTFEIASDGECQSVEILNDNKQSPERDAIYENLENVVDVVNKSNLSGNDLTVCHSSTLSTQEVESYTQICPTDNITTTILKESDILLNESPTADTGKASKSFDEDKISKFNAAGKNNDTVKEQSEAIDIQVKPISESNTSTSKNALFSSEESCDVEDSESVVCEESNISVALALKLEKEKLNEFNNNCVSAEDCNRSRSRSCQGKRNTRSASTGNFILQLESSETDNTEMLNNIKSGLSRRSIKKSSSFRIDRQNVYSPVDDGSVENMETIKNASKKVTDICRSFVQKARSSSRPRDQEDGNRVISPTPQRKLMKWVNAKGKWLRIPVNENLNDGLDAKKEEIDEIAVTCEKITVNLELNSNDELYKSEKQKGSDSIVTNDIKINNNENYISKETGEPVDFKELDNETNTANIDSESEKHVHKLEGDQTFSEVESNDHKKETPCETKFNLEPNQDITASEENIAEESKKAATEDSTSNNESESKSVVLEVGPKLVLSPTKSKPKLQLDINKANGQTNTNPFDLLRPSTAPVEPNNPANQEFPVMDKNDFLLGIKDNVSRRNLVKMLSPTRSPIQSVSSEFSTENTFKNFDSDEAIVVPLRIPKLTAVKIQEEIFEGNPEYMKECNIDPLGMVREKDEKPVSTISDHRKSRQFKDIKKAHTFTSLEDAKYRDRSSYTSEIVDKLQVNSDSNVLDLHSDETILNQQTETPKSNEVIEPKTPTNTDKRKVKLPVVIRERSLQRPKLLSEIVEVEENKDDSQQTALNIRSKQTEQLQQNNNKKERRLRKSGTTGNKRRSLSLPTGSLAFGDTRIVYKNGHFTFETMDDYKNDSSRPPDLIVDDDQNPESKMHVTADSSPRIGDSPVIRVDRKEVTEYQRPGLKRQCAKAVLTKRDSDDNVFYNTDNVTAFNGQRNESYSNSSHTSDMSLDSVGSVDHETENDQSAYRKTQQSSSSLPESGSSPTAKHEALRARRTSSFRRAQEAGTLDLISEQDGGSKLKESNQNSPSSQKTMPKRKTLNENMNLFSKQSESAKDFFSKRMNLKGLFKKNKPEIGLPSGSPLKTQHPVSPPIAAFQGDDDIGSIDTPPSSPGPNKDFRRRHTSADIYIKSFADASASESGSNCPTPTQERHANKQTLSTPTTPCRESNSSTKIPSNSSVCSLDEDRISVTSACSAASSSNSAQSPAMEQPHKPKTPKPVGASPRRSHSIGSQGSRTSYHSGHRDRSSTSVTSLESDNCDSIFTDFIVEGHCECEQRLSELMLRPERKVIVDFTGLCQFCQNFLEYANSVGLFNGAKSERQRRNSSNKDISGESNTSAKTRKDSASRKSLEKLAIMSQTAVVSSNSNDSGIQRDVSAHSSNESIKGTQDGQVLLRRKKSPSPQTERPKSEAGVRWADLDLDTSEFHQPVRLRRHAQMFKDRPRPKSDLDDSIQLFDELFDEILEDFETEGSSFLSERMKAFGSEIDLQPYCSLRNLYDMRKRDFDKRKNRRMSTPHPIKSRLHRSPKKLQKQPPLVRSSSMPESLDKITKRRKLHLLDYHMDSLQRHLDADDYQSDDSDLSFDQASLQERSLSIQSSHSQLTSMDEDEDNLIYAEALWDHITMVPDEIAFRAQDVIEVMDMRDKDWWYGAIDDKEGWFPAAFVRLRVNQDRIEEEDMEITLQETLTSSPKSRRISVLNKNQARTNVVNEIINAEREYVKHLKDVVEGYIQHARKRKEMFPEERIALIFGNIETIYSFAQKFLAHLEKCIDVCPHLSEIGQCFLDNERGFEVYSDYCNNHPSACEELKELCLDSKYRHFFEACRLLQELVEIPLEGFLLTPVQKICKYPLQLAELLKYTPPDHPDYMMVKDALSAMRKIATLINERKRKMESIEKIAAWQHTVVDWEGEDLLERSSELIFSGDINKVNTAGWSQERYFFLFDHQLIYCKKELLKRHVFSYKGRIDLDQCEVIDIPDGRDTQYNVSVKHGWKLHETHKDKWYLLYGKTLAVKERWLKALKDERKRVQEDRDNDFCVPDHWKQTVLNKVRSQSTLKDKHPTSRVNPSHQVPYHKDLKDFTYSTLPRRRLNSQKQDKKKGWFIFGGKKSKR